MLIFLSKLPVLQDAMIYRDNVTNHLHHYRPNMTISSISYVQDIQSRFDIPFVPLKKALLHISCYLGQGRQLVGVSCISVTKQLSAVHSASLCRWWPSTSNHARHSQLRKFWQRQSNKDGFKPCRGDGISMVNAKARIRHRRMFTIFGGCILNPRTICNKVLGVIATRCIRVFSRSRQCIFDIRICQNYSLISGTQTKLSLLNLLPSKLPSVVLRTFQSNYCV